MSELDKIKEMTEDELKSHLITCDYKGKDFKTEVLKQLIIKEQAKYYMYLMTT